MPQYIYKCIQKCVYAFQDDAKLSRDCSFVYDTVTKECVTLQMFL